MILPSFSAYILSNAACPSLLKLLEYSCVSFELVPIEAVPLTVPPTSPPLPKTLSPAEALA